MSFRWSPAPQSSAAARGTSPPPKAGLADIYGQVWRTGGTTARTGDELDDFLEMRAAQGRDERR